MNDSIINLDAAPKWDFYVQVRGMQIPMAAPADCADVPHAPLPTQRELDANAERWPGLFVWAWQFIVGGPRVDRGDLPVDGGAAHTRAVCLTILGEVHAELVESLSTAECSQIIAAYMGAQEKWLIATQQFAFAIADRKFDLSGGNKAASPASETPEGMRRIVPGGPVPAALNPKHHPKLVDDRGGKSA